jgi:hypothetical protein
MKRGVRLSLGLFALAAVACGYVWFHGSVTVHDETGSVTAAVITDGEVEYPLYPLPGGTFFRVMPRFDGEIEVRCRNGSTDRGAYVSHHMHTAVRVIEDVPCGFVQTR